MLEDTRVDPFMVYVYAHLQKLAKGRPSLMGLKREIVAKHCRCSERSLSRVLKELEDAGYIHRPKANTPRFEVEFVGEDDLPTGTPQSQSVVKENWDSRVTDSCHWDTTVPVLGHHSPSTGTPVSQFEAAPLIGTRGIEFNSIQDNQEALASQGESAERGDFVLSPKRPPKPSKVKPYQSALNFSEVEDDPETARLIASVHATILEASKRPRLHPEGDPSAVTVLESRIRDWRRAKFPASMIEKYLLKALAQVKPFDLGRVERFVATCLNGEAEKRETPVASLKAKPSPPINYVVATPRPGDPGFAEWLVRYHAENEAASNGKAH